MALGAGLGLVLALRTSRVAASLLFGVAPTDAPTYGGALLVALPLVVLAAAVPAVRAAHVEPMVELREP